MLNHWNDIERTWAAMEALRRGMDQTLGLPRFVEAAASRAPKLEIFEVEDGYLVTADLPGFAKEDVDVKFANDQLSLSAKRTPSAPEGYQALMEERGALQFTRTITFPAKVDADGIQAKLSDGVLEVRVPRHPEAKPRQIQISAS